MAHEFVWQGNHGLACLFVSSVSFWSVSHVFRGLKFVAFLLLLNGLFFCNCPGIIPISIIPFFVLEALDAGEGFLDVFSNLWASIKYIYLAKKKGVVSA